MIDFGPMHAQLFEAFAQPVTVDGVELQAVVTRDAEVMFEGGITDRRTMLDVRHQDRAHVRRGAVVSFEGATYTVDQIPSDDGHVVKVVLR